MELLLTLIALFVVIGSTRTTVTPREIGVVGGFVVALSVYYLLNSPS